MNVIVNDFDVVVTAIGSPGSLERVKVEFPRLIERINSDFWQAFPRLYMADADSMLDQAGIKSKLERNNIIEASAYGAWRRGELKERSDD